MPATVLRSEILTFARQAAGFDVVGTPSDQFVTDAEALAMVDRSACALYDLLIKGRGAEYYLTEFSFPTVAGQAVYALPADFYELSTVYVQATSLPGFVVLDEFLEREVAALRTQGVLGANYPGICRYRLRGLQGVPGHPPGNPPVALLELLPAPSVVFTVFVRYIPTCVRAVVNGADVTNPDVQYDGVNGWEEYIIYDVAAKLVIKEERDAAPYQIERGRVEKRIESLAGSRNVGEPERVVDTRGWLRRASMARPGGIRTRGWGF